MNQVIIKKSAKQLRLTVLSGLFGDFGSSIFSFGLSFMLLDRTGSVFSFAISNIVSPIIGLALLPLIGPIVDSFSKKKVIIVSQSITILSLIVYWILFPQFSSHLFLPTVVLIVVLRGSDQFTSTARQAASIQLVLPDDLQKLSAYSQMSTSTANIVSSIFGAFLYTLLPFQLFILFELVTEVFTAITTSILDFRFNKQNDTELIKDTIEDAEKRSLVLFKEGVTYIRNQKYLLFGMIVAVGINFISGIFSVGLPILVLQVFNLSNLHFGFAEAINGFGYVFGGLLLKQKLNIKNPILYSWKSALKLGVILIGIGLSISIGGVVGEMILYLLLFFTGILFVTINVPITVWLQKQLPPILLGRVFSVLGTIGLATAPIGVLLFGFIFNLNTDNLNLLTMWTFILTGVMVIFLNYLLLKIANLPLKEAKVYSVEKNLK
ncbi:MFS transporter [Marinilactibacillus psychrotolerans]|uniref:MFS transporter n=1 Tax=Marinilactibacillus psychrotolerans TaxID=191770 RepID=A0A5R9BWM8_9LACT|nr:MFS transporter [Marinilactibacillus psychrotolerans]TLQ04703.1 MFS transporter [Marinilactibacillus psychrotolerans]